MTPRETLYTQREAARTKKSQRSRRSVNEEKVHQMELLKDPLIVVAGGELVARELIAREGVGTGRDQAVPSGLSGLSGPDVWGRPS